MIQIYWSNIKNDVDKQTWRLANIHITDEVNRSDAQEDESTASVKFIMRFAEEGIAMVATALREVLEGYNASVTTAKDDISTTTSKWEFTLKPSSTVDESSMAMLIHKFVVEYILYRWSFDWGIDSGNTAKLFKEEYVSTLADIVANTFSLDWIKKNKRKPLEEEDTEVTISYE